MEMGGWGKCVVDRVTELATSLIYFSESSQEVPYC